MIDDGALGDNQADAVFSPSPIVSGHLGPGTPPGEKPRVIGAITMRLANVRCLKVNGVNRGAVESILGDWWLVTGGS